jgi:hypothetical protein
MSTNRVARLAVLAASALVAAAAQSSSSQAPDPILSAGGKDGCAATFASAELTQQAENWVAGVFLGKNYLNGTKAGSTIERAGIFSEVKQYCTGARLPGSGGQGCLRTAASRRTVASGWKATDTSRSSWPGRSQSRTCELFPEITRLPAFAGMWWNESNAAIGSHGCANRDPRHAQLRCLAEDDGRGDTSLVVSLRRLGISRVCGGRA